MFPLTPAQQAAADRILSLYEATAAAWAEARRDPTADEVDWLARFAPRLPASAGVLDLGCGNGRPIAETLLAMGHRITGVDGAPAQIVGARAALPEAEWIVADMRDLDLRRQFDGVLAWHSFFHLTAADQRAMFPVFARHLTPGGTLMFTSGPVAGVAMGEWEREPLFHASLAPDEYRALLGANGFEVLDHRLGHPVAEGSTIWLARLLCSPPRSP